ncbi:MAG: class I SAM-dependent methyltransferase [Gemmatimonadetes bacterium]|nr:class I SAM-dependent methyltransferase [Gemmatimonadota bacterium]
MKLERQHRLYTDLATWWPLFSPPSHYREEAEDLLPVLLAATDSPRTLLELGCGGGSLAYHFKDRLQLTLTDRSAAMLEVSRAVNPECEHRLGDMRSLDLGRHFELVLIHDAIMYATDAASVRATLATAHRHLRPGGAVVVIPDYVKETFDPGTSTGGEDGADGRGLRYLEWTWDPDSADDTYEVTWVFLLREASGEVRVESDRHRFGLFARAAWRSWLREVGFTPRSRIDPWRRDVFVGRRLDGAKRRKRRVEGARRGKGRI